jgi:SAM-dependent methyltransferase
VAARPGSRIRLVERSTTPAAGGTAGTSGRRALDNQVVEHPADLVRFYDEAYSHDADSGALYARWRTLGAVGKADHVMELCAREGIRPRSTLEIGCGDGAVLGELAGRGFGGSLHGVEITQAAVDIAAGRPELASVELYDGLHLPEEDGVRDLGILSHVLEHVPDPALLLAEAGRVCRAVIVEVPLESNWSARRAVKREHAAEVGHLQRLDRDAMREIVAGAGMRVAGEVKDPLPRSVHVFFAQGRSARALGSCKWAVRAGLHRLAPGLARRLFTVHYACLCLPRA